MAYRPRYEATRAAMDDTTDELLALKLDDDSERRIDDMNQLLGKVQRHAETTRDVANELRATIGVLRERLKWMWWVQGGQLAVLIYIAKMLFEYQVRKL